MLDEDDPAIASDDGEVGIAHLSVLPLKGSLVVVGQPHVVEFVGDDLFRLRPHQFAKPGEMDEVRLVEGPAGPHRIGVGQEVGPAPGGVGAVVARQIPQPVEIALMEEHHGLLLARQGGVDELAGEDATGVRKDHEGVPELAALRLVDGERVGQLKPFLVIVPKSVSVKPYVWPGWVVNSTCNCHGGPFNFEFCPLNCPTASPISPLAR